MAAPIWPIRVVLGVVVVLGLVALASNVYRYRRLLALETDADREY